MRDDKDAVTSSLACLQSHFDDASGGKEKKRKRKKASVKTVIYLIGPQLVISKGATACGSHFNEAFPILFSDASCCSGLKEVISSLLSPVSQHSERRSSGHQPTVSDCKQRANNTFFFFFFSPNNYSCEDSVLLPR